MALANVFDKSISDNIINRMNQLTPQTAAKWGKMNVAQMLAHCNVTYEMVYEEGKHPKAKGIMKLMLKWMVKPIVTNEVPYKHNSRTAPSFIIVDERNFESEKTRLINYIQKTQQLGATHFEGKESNSFGNLTSTEWNNMFYKHLDHHLSQFGV